MFRKTVNSLSYQNNQENNITELKQKYLGKLK